MVSVVSVVCEWVDWLIAVEIWGWCNEGYGVHNVHTVHTVRSVHTVCTVHTVHVLFIETVLCAALGTASQKYVLCVVALSLWVK
jgi:hypothetical protein